ncbi:MAG: hypothetical protein Pg6C_10140 [Treponemataceae bacterium]|nr:MAG: hypothetical protein Pg6C_10140 [Treponemataceae bacterium]
MIDFIEKEIDPPGIKKKNRRSIFSIIGDVAGLVKTDAEKAFNAHFPYLADDAKLDEHGKALLIPRLLDDTAAEYRDRVSTASFFLMRAGERAYIIEQLNAHFGNRYIARDEFLEVYVKVQDINETDRKWLLQFLDELINTNVRLGVSEWFHIIDKLVLSDGVAARAAMPLNDSLNSGWVKLNGRVKLDGRTLNTFEQIHPALSGHWKLNGVINLSGADLTLPATGVVRVPVKLGRGILDKRGINIKTNAVKDIFARRVKLSGGMKLDGAEKLNGFGRLNEKLNIWMRYHRKLSGEFTLNGSVKLNSGDLLQVREAI